jgi:hypothetical protein
MILSPESVLEAFSPEHLAMLYSMKPSIAASA